MGTHGFKDRKEKHRHTGSNTNTKSQDTVLGHTIRLAK
jgi:hypothetical protein